MPVFFDLKDAEGEISYTIDLAELAIVSYHGQQLSTVEDQGAVTLTFKGGSNLHLREPLASAFLKRFSQYRTPEADGLS